MTDCSLRLEALDRAVRVTLAHGKDHTDADTVARAEAFEAFLTREATPALPSNEEPRIDFAARARRVAQDVDIARRMIEKPAKTRRQTKAEG